MAHHHPARITRQALRRSRGNVAQLLQLGLAGCLRIRQNGGVDMDDHLVPLTRRPGIELMMQRALGEEAQRIGLLLHARRSRGAGTGDASALIKCLARGVERTQEHGARLGVQPAAEHHRAIVVRIDVKPSVGVLARRPTGPGPPIQLSPPADDPLHVDGGARASHRKEASLGLGRGDPGQSPDLGVGELPAREGFGQPRKRTQRVGNADPLARRAGREADSPGEPLRAGPKAPVPPSPLIELADQREQPRGGRVEMGGQLGDLVAESVQLRDDRVRGYEGECDGGRVDVDRHGGLLSAGVNLPPALPTHEKTP